MEEDNKNGPGPSTSSSSQVIHLSDNKAGMEGLDIEKINKIINQSSKGSKFYEHKKQRQEELKKRVVEMQGKLAKLSPEVIAKAEKQVDEMVKEMEKRRDLSRYMVHFDMDCFFAAVEIRDDPTLKDIPMAVGSKSMLSTSNYIARRFGVRSAMPGFIGLKLCPQLKIVPPNFQKYKAASKEVESVLEEYDKESLSMCMDEAVMDVTNCLAERNSVLPEGSKITVEELVHEIRGKIFKKTGLTASAGIAPNGLLAKICSDVNKPNNQYFLEPRIESVDKFVKELPIRKVCGIGPVTEQTLNGLGIHTCGDLWEKRAIVNLLYKPATASFLLAVSKGVGSSFFSHEDSATDSRKSFSYERTFGKATKEELKQLCQNVSQELEKDLEKKGVTCKTITLKIKLINFEVKTRARSIASFTSNASVICDIAWSIYCSYEKEIPDLKLRLFGIRVSNLRFFNDEGEDGGKKQQTLSQMFRLNQANQSYPCVSCGEQFSSLLNLHTHYDECLADPNPDLPTAATATIGTEDLERMEVYVQDPPNNSAVCPVCSRTFQYQSIEEMDVKFNSHIDECLNVPTMSKLREEENKPVQQTPPNTSSPFTSNRTAIKRSSDSASGSTPKSAKHSSNKKSKPGTSKITKTKSKSSGKSVPSDNGFRYFPIDTYFNRESSTAPSNGTH